MKIHLERTKSFADEVRRCSVKPLALEPDLADRLLTEVANLRKQMDTENRDPMEQIMIEQVLAAHTQNLVAMYQLENMPINTDNTRQRRHLADRVHTTHLRLCKSMAMLTALRMVGPRLGLDSNMAELPPKKSKKVPRSEVGPADFIITYPDDPKADCWLFMHRDARKDAMEANRRLIKWRDHYWAHPEAYEDDPPVEFVEFTYHDQTNPTDEDDLL